MYRAISAALVFLLSISFSVSSFALSDRGLKPKPKRLALVIGNSDYKSSPLKNPANDSLDVAHLLTELDFTVIHKQNVGLKVMERTIRDFGRKLRDGGVGLFYFAGHGMQVKGNNYLIPVDADIESASDVRFEAIDVGRVLGKMEDADNDLNIVILDACRDNPFGRSFRSSRRGLAHMDAPKGTFVAYATAPGAVAADGAGRNGIYTKYLLEQMKVPGLEIERLFKNVRIRVIKETTDKQVPWESSSLTGNFYFNTADKSRGSEAVSSHVEFQNSPDRSGSGGGNYEIVFWESINGSSDEVLYREYLKKFPDGLFASLAKREIEKHNSVRQTAGLSDGMQVTQRIMNQGLSTNPTFCLRKKGAALLSDAGIARVILQYGFYDGNRNSDSSFTGTFISEKEGVVRDAGTGLFWQKNGSHKAVSMYRAKKYISKINKEKYAGYSDWRLPTVEELASLLQKKKNSDGLHINSLFDQRQKRCWSSDGADCMHDYPGETAAWVADYREGKIRKANWFKIYSNPWYLQFEYLTENYVRAVRP